MLAQRPSGVFLIVLLVLAIGSACSPTDDPRDVLIVSEDGEVVCFVNGEGRRLCPSVENAQPLLAFDVGDCARIRFAGQTLEIGSAERIECTAKLRSTTTGTEPDFSGAPGTTSLTPVPRADDYTKEARKPE